MVTYFSKRTYQRVFLVVAWITVLSMAITSGVYVLFKSQGAGSNFMSINGYVVGMTDVRKRMRAQERRIELLRMQFEQAGIPFDPRMMGFDPQRAALQGLIEDVLLNEVADTLNVRLNEQHVTRKITDPNFLIQEMSEYVPPYLFAMQQDINFAVIERVLRSEGLSVVEFEQHVEQYLRRNVVKELLAAAFYAPTYILKNVYMQQYAAKKYTVLAIPFEQVLATEKAKQLASDEIKKFYQQEAKHFAIPEKRSAIVWEFNPRAYGIQVTDAEVSSYYDAHKSKYLQNPAQINVRHLLFKVEKPEDLMVVYAKAESALKEFKHGTYMSG